jgi:hypothetical protein
MNETVSASISIMSTITIPPRGLTFTTIAPCEANKDDPHPYQIRAFPGKTSKARPHPACNLPPQGSRRSRKDGSHSRSRGSGSSQGQLHLVKPAKPPRQGCWAVLAAFFKEAFGVYSDPGPGLALQDLLARGDEPSIRWGMMMMMMMMVMMMRMRMI